MAIEVSQQALTMSDAELGIDGSINSLNAYTRQAKKFSVLSREKEKNLAQLASSGSLEARQELILHNLRLVISIAQRFAFTKVPLLDLIQEGNVGLIEAIGKFDPALGYKFSTFATRPIGWAIKKAIAEKYQEISMPDPVFYTILAQEDVKHSLEQELQRPPTKAEVLEKLSASQKKLLKRVENLPRNIVSINFPVGNDEENAERGEFIADETELGANPADVVVDILTSASITTSMRQTAEQICNGKSKKLESPDQYLEIYASTHGFLGRRQKPAGRIGQRFGISRQMVDIIDDNFTNRLQVNLRTVGLVPDFASTK
jgi:RNA polymerase sigma factor (sigma-70 family)